MQWLVYDGGGDDSIYDDGGLRRPWLVWLRFRDGVLGVLFNLDKKGRALPITDSVFSCFWVVEYWCHFKRQLSCCLLMSISFGLADTN